MQFLEDKGEAITEYYMDALRNNATYVSAGYFSTLKEINGNWINTDYQLEDD